MKQVRLLLLLSCFMAAQLSTAQVTSVSLHDRYDAESNTYTMQLIVNEGAATTSIHRIQLNAQISIVSPAGNPIKIIESLEPLQGNVEPFSGTTPANWKISGIVEAPEITPESSYFAVTPTLSPTARYNRLEAGQCVDLFTYQAEGCTTDCARLFKNGTDPSASMPGMNGADLTIGMTMGTLEAIFDGINENPSCLLSSTIDDLKDIAVYPNPTRDLLTVESSTVIGKVQIYNTAGMLLREFSGSQSNLQHIDVSDLSPGQYTVAISSTASITHKSIVKL